MVRSLVLVACFLSLVPADADELPPSPPRAAVRPISETYFGTVVVDPYRYMEDGRSAEVQRWVKAQDDYARALLARIPGRDALRTRLGELSGADTSVTDVTRIGGHLFFLERAAGQNSFSLVTAGADGPRRVLFDPETTTVAGSHLAIDYFAPSLDGTRVAYGASPGGSENSVLYVVETATGKKLGDKIDRAQAASPAWLPDGRSFLYTRQQKLAPGMPETARYQKTRVYLHVVGTPADRDRQVFGFGAAPDIAVDDTSFGYYSPASPYVLGLVQHGAKAEITVMAAPLDGFARGKPSWRKLVDVADEVVGFDVHGDDLYLLSQKEASRRKILVTSIARPDVSHATVVVPAGRAVLTLAIAARDALYVRGIDGGQSRLWRVAWGRTPAEVALPFAGTLRGLSTSSDTDGATFAMEGWTRGRTLFAYDPAREAATDLALIPPSAVDFARIEIEEVTARSADGTMVPLSILHARALALDGANPTLLMGYGSYGAALEPGFQPSILAWLERGGVYAVAHVRGGGEFGEDWHRAGMKTTKQHTIDDFIACAQYLVEHKLTRPDRLAGEGTSAGGITIAGAITERPDLFGAALIHVGDSDILRTEFATDGPGNALEYGSVKVPEEFAAMVKISGYQRVRDGVKYPAVMLTGGANDPRVALFQSTKMAARLQAATASGKPILLRVDFDGGHGSIGATRAQRDAALADSFAFLLWQLGAAGFQPG